MKIRGARENWREKIRASKPCAMEGGDISFFTHSFEI
jgi:hypothetical protein